MFTVSETRQIIHYSHRHVLLLLQRTIVFTRLFYAKVIFLHFSHVINDVKTLNLI